MRIIDVLHSSECELLFKEIQEFVSLSLSEYNETIENVGFCFSDKDIFDFVWGTVNFSAAEICVLDSPLLQRLRRIHQLGLASSVYCNADSSRFSHTIGVTEVAGRMVQVIRGKLNETQNMTYSVKEIVRLAAIFHDVGHMFYSHVSELYYSYDESFPKYDEITSAKTHFCEMTAAEVSLHELISVMVVNSSETLRLIKNIAPFMQESRLTQQGHYEQLAEYISCLIIGIPIDKFILPYSAIINSAIDADKLDYLSRDSACTKVPIAVDIARIIQKLDVVSIKEIEFPNIWNDTTLEATPLKIMAIKSSAKKVFWQLSNARSNMYESVYYHHKVMTAETMFRKVLKRLYENEDKEKISFANIMIITDDVFNEYWDLVLLEPEKRESAEAQEISKILKNVRERNLYKRVAAFSKNSLTGSLSAVRKFFRNVIQDPLSSDYHEFIALMKEEYNMLHNLLGIKDISCVSPEFMFVYSKYDAMSSMPIESGDGYCIWSSTLMKQETMEAGKKSKQEQFYLLTDRKDRGIVYLALEKSLTKFGISQLSKKASMCSKVPYEEINKTRMRLLECGYYKDSMFLLQDDIFFRLLDKKLFKEVVNKFRSFLGVKSCQVTEESLLKFMRQFLWLNLEKAELELLLDGVLRLLKSAYYLDRDSFSSQVRTLLEQLSESYDEHKHIITLGGLFDSSKHLMYYFNDIKGAENITFDGSLEVALDSMDENNCLCFFDDGAYSGKQVISIFQELMGIPIDERTTSEHHVDELTSKNKEKLKETKIILAYLCCNGGATDYKKSKLNEIGLKKVEIHFVKDLSLKVFDNANAFFLNDKQKKIVCKCLKTVGKEIMLSSKILPSGEYKPRWNEERIREASLGYNDAQQMVVFSTNIPTYSITAFWANGNYQGKDWQGLFQRTNKG